MHALLCMLAGKAPDWSCYSSRKHHGLSTIGCSWCHAMIGLVHVPAMVILRLAYLSHVLKGFRPQVFMLVVQTCVRMNTKPPTQLKETQSAIGS